MGEAHEKGALGSCAHDERETVGEEESEEGKHSQVSRPTIGSHVLPSGRVPITRLPLLRLLRQPEHQPAFWRASSCKSGFWSAVETRAYPMRMRNLPYFGTQPGISGFETMIFETGIATVFMQ